MWEEEEKEEREKFIQISVFVRCQDVSTDASLGAKFPVGQPPPREIVGVIVKAIVHGRIVISGEVLDGSHVLGQRRPRSRCCTSDGKAAKVNNVEDLECIKKKKKSKYSKKIGKLSEN